MNKLIETIKTPQDSVNDDSVIVMQILVQNGQKISENELLAEIETSKAVVEIVSETAGYVKLFCEVDQEVLIGETLFEIYEGELSEKELKVTANTSNSSKNASTEAVELEEKESMIFDTKFSKEAQILIDNKNIDTSVFNSRQYVTSKDVLEFLNPGLTNTSIKDVVAIKKSIHVNHENAKILGKQKLNEIQYLSSVNASGLVSRLTVSVKGSLEVIAKSQNFITTTPLPIIAHEVSRLLIKYPNLNSYFDANQQIFNKSINVGIAVDNGVNGLKVAGIVNCDEKNLLEIEEEITNISLKYNDNKLSLEDISSSTFTITDLFSAGVTNFHPLINFNNSAILGICGLKENTFDLELAFDHRISNGLEVSKFLKDLKTRVEHRLNIASQEKKNKELNKIECYKCLRPITDDLNGNVYFIKVSNTKLDSHICSNCFNGF